MKEAAHYTKMANQRKLAASAMPLLSIDHIENKTLPLQGMNSEGGSISREKAKSIRGS
jgi:hypothetical protein